MSDYLREIKAARIDQAQLTVELSDGFTFTAPLKFYPTLLLASEQERNAMEVLPYSRTIASLSPSNVMLISAAPLSFWRVSSVVLEAFLSRFSNLALAVCC